jgi:uncharacterized protein YecT (DUF1311 family)
MQRSALLVLCIVAVAASNTAKATVIHGTVCTENRNVREAETCLERALKDAEAELKKKYTAIAALLGTNDRKEALARSQRTWGTYVEETCEGLIKPATKESRLGRADVLSCKTELTIERTSDLDRMFYVALHD